MIFRSHTLSETFYPCSTLINFIQLETEAAREPGPFINLSHFMIVFSFSSARISFSNVSLVVITATSVYNNIRLSLLIVNRHYNQIKKGLTIIRNYALCWFLQPRKYYFLQVNYLFRFFLSVSFFKDYVFFSERFSDFVKFKDISRTRQMNLLYSRFSRTCGNPDYL